MLSILEQFRNDVYTWFSQRADALMDLLDALSSNTTARSVVELSEHPLFRRQYSSIHDGIEHLFVPNNKESQLQERREWEHALIRLLVPYLPRPALRFWLLGTDVTSAARPFARTLSDRTCVYTPNPVKGVKPITIGHQYSVVALLPEKASSDAPPWVLPLLVNRVPSTETTREAGQKQIARPPIIELFTEDFPPFNFANDKQEIIGIATEMVLNAFAMSGLKHSEVRLYPWKRAFKEGIENPNAGIFATYRTEVSGNNVEIAARPRSRVGSHRVTLRHFSNYPPPNPGLFNS